MLLGIGHMVNIELINIVKDLCRIQGNNNLSFKSAKFVQVLHVQKNLAMTWRSK